MQRTDTATISLTLSYSPEIVRDYFDGLAKVEAAKKATSDANLSSLLTTFGPSIASFCKSKETKNVKEEKEEKTEITVGKQQSNNLADIVASSVDKITSSIAAYQNQSDTKEEITVGKKEEIKITSTDDCYQDLSTLIKENKDIAILFSKIKQDRNMLKLMEIFNNIPDNQESIDKEKEVKDEVKMEIKEEIKGPFVRDGNKIVIDPNNIQNIFNGQGGLGDMFKSFQGIVNNMNQTSTQTNAQTNEKPASTKSKKKSQTAMDILTQVEENDQVD